MDLYQKNPTIINKLLAKRQNPSCQTFNSPSSSLPNKNLNSQNINLSSVPTTTALNFNSQPQPQIQFNSNVIIIITSSKGDCNNSTDQQTTGGESEAASEDGSGGGDLHLEDKKNKKIKLNPEAQDNKRRNSYEEELDCNSTGSETYSDGHSYELSEYCSPLFTNQGQKEPHLEEFKLDDEDEYNVNHSKEEKNLYLKEAQEKADKLEGICLSTKCDSDQSIIKMICKYKHSWDTCLQELRDKWCPKCEKNLNGLKEFAVKNGGCIKNNIFTDLIIFECSRKHCWTIFHKNAKRKWCSECTKEEKEEIKKRFEQEKMQRQKEDEELQKRLFEEARRKASQQTAKNSINSNPMMPGCTRPLLEYYQRVDYDIENLAKKYTTEFMNSKEFFGQCTFQQILQVYKILMMPEEILKTYMMNLPADSLKAEFRRLAKLIHPDKNSHPKAGLAFHKIHKIFEATISRYNGSL